MFQAFANMIDLKFSQSLKSLIINAPIIKDMNASEWQEEQPDDEKTFQYLNTFICRLDQVEHLELIGMSLVDHLQDLTVAIKRPKLKSLAIPYNGITYEFCVIFNHVLNFETLQELNLSCNWFGLPGLEKFCSSFKKFENLKKLNLNNNKLCIEEDKDPRPLRDLLLAVSKNLTEL